MVSPGWAAEEIVAVGDGFKVTMDYVKKLEERMGNESASVTFTSSEEEHRKAAIKIRVFAEEAKALGLDKLEKEKIRAESKDKTWNINEDSVEWHMTLAWRYNTKLMKEYHLDDVVMESYYRANQEKFVDKESGELLPLDENLKEDIRKWIVLAKKTRIANTAFENLKEKYHVRICEQGTGKCQ